MRGCEIRDMPQEKLSIQEIVETVQGKLIGKRQAVFLLPSQKISTDTRELKKGDLFIALEGKRFDGHRFIEEASEKGACGAIVSEVISVVSEFQCFLNNEQRATSNEQRSL